MSKHRIRLAAAIGLLIVFSGCGGRAGSDTAAPANSEAETPPVPAPSETARSERPAAKQGTLRLEGSEEPFTFELFSSSAVALPVAFTTYVPNDMIAEPASAGGAVRFVANFGGRRQDLAYVEVVFFPPATAESEARSSIGQTAPGGAPLTPAAEASRQFTWSLVEYGISYSSKADGRMTGTTALGSHAGRLFQITLHYPEEYGDGFVPRAYRILEEWRWGDDNQGL